MSRDLHIYLNGTLQRHFRSKAALEGKSMSMKVRELIHGYVGPLPGTEKRVKSLGPTFGRPE